MRLSSAAASPGNSPRSSGEKRCPVCDYPLDECCCDDDYDADELGLDPEEEYDA